MATDPHKDTLDALAAKGRLRVDLEHETLGLDFATHGESGYHMNR